MSITLIIRAIIAMGAFLYVGIEFNAISRYRPTLQDFSNTKQISGKFTLTGTQKAHGGSINGMRLNFDACAYGEFSGAPAVQIPNGTLIIASVAMVRTRDGTIPVLVKAEADGKVIFYNTPEQCVKNWKSDTMTAFYSDVGFAFTAILFSFGISRKK